MSTCKKVYTLLALRPEDWSSNEQSLVKTHLSTCSGCVALAQTYAEQDHLLHNSTLRVSLTPSQRGQLLSQIQNERRRYTMFIKLSLIVSSITAVAILGALGLGLEALVPKDDFAAPVSQPMPVDQPAPVNQSTPILAAQSTSEVTPLPTSEATLSLVWPVEGRSGANYHVTQDFSNKHPALDIAAKEGTPVLAAAAGEVVFVGNDEVYGHNILIDHGNGLRTFYSKLLDYQVAPGDEVIASQQIGRVGSTGTSTGPHLHFEVRQHVNPWPLLP